MKVNMFEGAESHAEVNRTPNFSSFTVADEVGQECGNEIMDFTCNEQVPEYMLCNAIERTHCQELSPKFILRTPKFKLNLDIPEDISNVDDTYGKNYPNNGRIDEIKSNLYHSILSQQTSLTSDQCELIKSNKGKHINIDTIQPIPVCVNNKILSNKYDNRTMQFRYQNIGSSLVTPSNKLTHNINLESNYVVQPEKNISPPKIIIPDSHNNNNDINAKIETHVSMDESSIFHHNNWTNNNVSFKLQWWKVPFTKCYGFSYWLSNRIFELIKTNYQRFRQHFVLFSLPSATIQGPKKSSEEVSDITSIIRAENERMLSLFTEKFNNMAQELNQVHVLNENTFSIMKTELDIFKNTSNKLLDNTDAFSKELTVLSKKLDNTIKINSTTLSRVNESGIPQPPPPPPIPLSLPATPKCQNRTRIFTTPTRKCSTPLMNGRPVITVEDLQKVTLKKAPQKNKENNPRNNVQTPRGPVVSLDMLRSVKLKSTRRSKTNEDTKNVRSPRRTLKGHGTQSISLSPIMAGAVSPLSGILKQVDNRWASKKTLMSPTHSDNHSTKDSPKKINMTRPSNSSHTINV